MASKKEAEKYESPIQAAKRICADDKYRVIFAIFLIIISFISLISFFSFLFTWKSDQSKFDLGLFQYIFDGDIQVLNRGGKLGALLAQVFIHNWFGIPSFTFIFLAVNWALKLLKSRYVPMGKALKYSIIGMVWTSIMLSFVFGDDFFFLGGVFGYEVNLWLESVLGKAGTFLILMAAALAFVILNFDNSWQWIKIFFSHLFKYRNIKDAFVNANTLAGKTNDLKNEKNTDSKSRNFSDLSKSESDKSHVDRSVLDDDDADSLNAPVNASQSDEAKMPFAAGAANFFKTKLFKSKDYKGADQQLNFNNSENSQTQVANHTEQFVLAPDGKRVDLPLGDESLKSNLPGFEIEDTTDSDNESQAENAAVQPGLNAQVGGDANAAILSDGPDLEVEKNTMLTVEQVKNLPPYDPTLELSDYKMPEISLLEERKKTGTEVTKDELISNRLKIVEALKNFKIEITKIRATIGPTVTLYEIIPAPGVRISKIKNLEDDIMLNLKAMGIRILAPMPGRGTVGIEVPNQNPEVVSMRSLIQSVEFQNSTYELPIALGKTIANKSFVMDLTKCPHLLVAGATGQGKSVGLNAIIASILYKKHPAEAKFVLIDPKKVELTLYEKIERHYLAKLPDSEEAIITDTKKVILTLNSITVEMGNRYDMLKEAQCRNIKEYNDKFVSRQLNPEKGHKYLPYIIVIIDEFADLIMTAGKEIEKPIARIAQLARAVGIHLIVATQRPTTNIITGLIKANFPTRIAFKVTSMIDSRTILDSPGANHLIGRGDMLINQGTDLVRLQCAFIDTPELENITSFIGNQRAPQMFMLPEPDIDNDEEGASEVDLGKRDSLFDDAARVVVISQQGSTSLIQRKLSIGYNRAGRIIDQLEAAGIVGPFEGSKARSVNYDSEYDLEQYLEDLRRQDAGRQQNN